MITTLLALGSLALQQPGTADFAQGVEYRIEASLDEATDLLDGRAEVGYTNNSPAVLDTLWFHQHLNAFRPNSAWAVRELAFDVRRFQELSGDQHAFERLTGVTVDGQAVSAVYPGSPDSTVFALPLSTPLSPGESIIVRLDWNARLSTTPRRQGRSGRHYDWAQWYPRIAVFGRNGWVTQPLLPQGEFFGEFASYDVTLDLAADQVVGATGVAVEGDPGWTGAARNPTMPVVLNRDAYPPTVERTLGLLSATPSSDRKRIRWRAEDVHHFAWSASPDFVYEGGGMPRSESTGDTIAIHVLYWPGDTDWANGVALGRTVAALDWLQDRIGPYPWPQLTNLHRIEPGGTEFPMLVMNGSPSEGLIVHEATHQYLHGILANNEFLQGWMDEGFTSYLTNRYFEEAGQAGVWAASLYGLRGLERAGRTEPIALAGADFQDPNMYSAMTYTKAALVFRMLEWQIGEETMRTVLRTFFERHALSHVDEQDFRRVVADVTGEDYDWFFDQWIHTTDTLDYGIMSARTSSDSGGRWRTRVDVGRVGGAWMPVTLQVGEARVRLNSRDKRQLVEVVTEERPTEAALDPEDILLDLDPTNNVRAVEAR